MMKILYIKIEKKDKFIARSSKIVNGVVKPFFLLQDSFTEIRQEIKRNVIKKQKGEILGKKEEVIPHYVPEPKDKELFNMLKETVKNNKEISKLISINKKSELKISFSWSFII